MRVLLELHRILNFTYVLYLNNNCHIWCTVLYYNMENYFIFIHFPLIFLYLYMHLDRLKCDSEIICKLLLNHFIYVCVCVTLRQSKNILHNSATVYMRFMWPNFVYIRYARVVINLIQIYTRKSSTYLARYFKIGDEQNPYTSLTCPSRL